MALLSRLFGGRKKSTSKSPKSYENVPEFNPWQPLGLESDQVTVLVYRECEQRGRRLLFDSSTVRRLPCGADHTGLHEVENDMGFKYTRQRADAKQLGEMVFGAVAMAYGGPTCKVHVVKGGEQGDTAAPDALMFSRVFPVSRFAGRRARTHGSSGTSLDDSCSSTGSELSLLRLGGGGHPSPHHPRSSSMDCPPPAGRLSEDSGLSSIDSFMGPPSYLPTPYGTPLSAQGSGASLGSHGSLQRSSRLRPIGSSDLMLTSRDDVTCTLRMTSRTRLAVSVMVTLSGPARSVLEDTLLQYSAQLEHLLARLQQSAERGYHSRRYFVRTVYQATVAAKQDLQSLLSAPRLPRPVWLGLTSDFVTSRQRQRLADLFVSELTSLITELDTKEHNCFMSTLLTAVLTHHLHWVVTVAPRCGGRRKLQPPPPARTLVVGRRTELVRRLLLVLSYFIREQLVSETMPWSFSPLRVGSGPAPLSVAAGGRDASCASLSVAAGGRDASCGSLRASDAAGSTGSLRASNGRLSGSSTTLRAEDGAEPTPDPRSDPRPDPRLDPRSESRSEWRSDSRPELRPDSRSDSRLESRSDPRSESRPEPRRTPSRGTLAVPASGRAVPGLSAAQPAGGRSRSRFYVSLDGRRCCEEEAETVTAAAARSRFYRPLRDADERRCVAETVETETETETVGTVETVETAESVETVETMETVETVETAESVGECDEGYGARTDGEDAALADSGCDTVDSGCDAADPAPLEARARRTVTRTGRDAAQEAAGDAVKEPRRPDAAVTSPCRPLPTTPSLVITDTSLCAPVSGSPRGAVTAGLAVPAVPQSRSCEPLGRAAAPPRPTARRLSRSSVDLRVPVRFLVGGDEDAPEDAPEDAREDAREDTMKDTVEDMERRSVRGGAAPERHASDGVERRRRGNRAAGASESSDDDSGFAGCERCSGRVPGDPPDDPPPPPPPYQPDVAGAGAAHVPLSRRHSDSIRDTSHYLRGYRSFRFSQPPPGRSRKSRHVSDGSSPSPPAVATAAPQPQPSPPPAAPAAAAGAAAGRRLCRCEEAARPAGPLRTQTALLETGRGGPGRPSLSPWSALGGGGAAYVPDLALWGCGSRAAWESRLRPDLQAAADAGGESTCVLADTDACSVRVLSSHAFPVSEAGGGGLSGLGVVFAPLVSGLVESVCRVHGTGAPASLVLHHLESQLAQLTARAAELAQFLINSSLANMQELTELLSVDCNDVPLLLSAAAVLCPEVGSKYGISVR